MSGIITCIASEISRELVRIFYFMILRGIQQVTFINTFVTIAKIIPSLVFILILSWRLSSISSARISGGKGMPDTSLFEQVRATMLVTVFVFSGIEGASVAVPTLRPPS
jgi:arginine:ornithine antiporter/lysine permease